MELTQENEARRDALLDRIESLCPALIVHKCIWDKDGFWMEIQHEKEENTISLSYKTLPPVADVLIDFIKARNPNLAHFYKDCGK